MHLILNCHQRAPRWTLKPRHWHIPLNFQSMTCSLSPLTLILCNGSQVAKPQCKLWKSRRQHNDVLCFCCGNIYMGHRFKCPWKDALISRVHNVIWSIFSSPCACNCEGNCHSEGKECSVPHITHSYILNYLRARYSLCASKEKVQGTSLHLHFL